MPVLTPTRISPRVFRCVCLCATPTFSASCYLRCLTGAILDIPLRLHACMYAKRAFLISGSLKSLTGASLKTLASVHVCFARWHSSNFGSPSIGDFRSYHCILVCLSMFHSRVFGLDILQILNGARFHPLSEFLHARFACRHFRYSEYWDPQEVPV